MGGVWGRLGLVFILVLLNAAFAGSEMALVSLRQSQLRRIERRSRTGTVLARLVREPNRYLATIQVGITLAGFLASASAAVSLAGPIEDRLGFMGRAAQATAVVAVTVVLAYFTLVFGELAPKRLAMQRPERWGLIAARPLAAMAYLTRPVIWLLSVSTNIAVRLLGGDPSVARQEVTLEELRDMVATQSSFTAQHRRIIDGAFEIAERSLQEVMRPRPDVFYIEGSTPCAQAKDELAESGHSRAPIVSGGSLDDVVGIVHLHDLLLNDVPGATARSVAIHATVFPESLGALAALRKMQRDRIQMAIVVNEHGGAEGIVTVEDLVEELVGEIYDETDRDIVAVRRNADGSLILPGRFPVHDLPDLGVEVPEGQYATVAGYLLWRLQRVPERPGDSVEVDGCRLTVSKVEEHAITEVRLTYLQSAGRGIEPNAEDAADSPRGEPGPRPVRG